MCEVISVTCHCSAVPSYYRIASPLSSQKLHLTTRAPNLPLSFLARLMIKSQYLSPASLFSRFFHQPLLSSLLLLRPTSLLKGLYDCKSCRKQTLIRHNWEQCQSTGCWWKETKYPKNGHIGELYAGCVAGVNKKAETSTRKRGFKLDEPTKPVDTATHRDRPGSPSPVRS